jgi:hypothetical protein
VEYSIPRKKRQPNEKGLLEGEEINTWGVGRRWEPRKCRCHKCSAPALPRVPACLEGAKEAAGWGGWRGGGVVEPEGQQLAVHLGPSSPKPPPEGSQHPHPFPISRRWVCQTLALTARSRAEASAPHDVTRGAAKGRGPCLASVFPRPPRLASPRLASPPPRGGVRMRSVHSGFRLAAARQRGGRTKGKPNGGARVRK